METIVYLVRHAQASPSPAVPEPEWPLSSRGLEQARGLVPVLTALKIERLYCSPFRRCRETLQPFATAAGLEVCVHDGLRERCLCPGWIGDFREIWQRSWADFSYALEGGESSQACRDRMATAVGEIAQRHPGETLALGSHGYAIGLFLTTVESTYGVAEASALRTPEIVRLVCHAGQAHWDRDFRPGETFDRLATDFRQTPGIVA